MSSPTLTSHDAHATPAADAAPASASASTAGCPHCTTAPSPRIDWRFVAREVEHGLVSMDRGLFYTLRLLMFRPGRLLRDYLAGRRAGHVKPLWLLLATAAAVVFTSRYLAGSGNAVAQFGAGYESGVMAGGTTPELQAMLAAYQRINTWMGEHFAAATLLLVPLEAALLKLAFWRSNRLNYPEWLTITAFLTAQTFVLWVLFELLEHWVTGARNWMIVVAIAYSIVSLMFAFAPYPKWKSALRGALGFALFGVGNVVVLGAIAIVAAQMARGG